MTSEAQERYLDDSYDRKKDDQLTEESEEISLWYENLPSKEQSDIRYAFEEDLIENWYVPFTVSEVDDWRDEFLREWYKNI